MLSQSGQPGCTESVLKVHGKRRTCREMEVDVISVAMLVAEGLGSKQIADRLDIKLSRVKRLRIAVKAKRLLVLDESKTSGAEACELARRQAFPSSVLDRLQELAQRAGVQPIKRYHCVFTPGVGGVLDWASRLAKFARVAQPLVLQALAGARFVGVTYGETLLKVFEGAALQMLGDQVTFFPTCCDPNRYQDAAWGSSNLARVLTQAQGKKLSAPSLNGTWPVLPPGQSQKTNDRLRKMLEDSPGFQKIFGENSEALIRQMDALVTSIGRTEQPWSLGDDYLLSMLGIDRSRLNALLAADIGGIPIAKHGLREKDRALFNELNACRIGMTLEHLQRTFSRGLRGPAPGVIVVATGGNKAQCLLELVRRGLVNIAIVDDELEKELTLALDQLLGKRRQG